MHSLQNGVFLTANLFNTLWGVLALVLISNGPEQNTKLVENEFNKKNLNFYDEIHL